LKHVERLFVTGEKRSDVAPRRGADTQMIR